MARGGPLTEPELLVIEGLAEGDRQVDIARRLGWDVRSVHQVVKRLLIRHNFETTEQLMYAMGRMRERMIRDGMDVSEGSTRVGRSDDAKRTWP